jgi:hypothetical protein
MTMDIAIETITPAKAASWLNLNVLNRPLRDGIVEKYADDMRSGCWTDCPEPISFYEDDELADGQHRLYAIVEAGVTLKLPVARNVRREAGLNINTGLPRTIVDAARISGADPDLTNALIGTARAVAVGEPQRTALSNASKLALVELHREASQWAVSNCRHVRYLCNAVIMGAIARAYMHERDHELLKRFCTVLGTGFSEGEKESSAIALRNYLIARASANTSPAMWRDTFLKVQNAIHYFMRGKKLTVIKGVAEEAYPLKKPKQPQRKAA